MKKYLFLLACVFCRLVSFALDNTYHYSIDLTKISGGLMTVDLVPPLITENTIVFSLPKIVPGTYSIYDFGRFVQDFKALDVNGKELPISHIDSNSWQISNSSTLSKISYKVRDTYHASSKDNPIFEPAGTDFQKDTCYVLNQHTFIGYFREHTKQPFELTVTHQPGLFGSTSLMDLDNSQARDRYDISSYNEAVDNPIMYAAPDTAHLRVGESDILIALYSPSHGASAKQIAIQLDTLLQDQGKYLGGKLPVKNYSFLIYLSGHEGLGGSFGALEHSYGSMYFLIDGDNKSIASTVRDVASHEFFHIVTPLTIHSEEIANFDFDHPKMSEHLWFYEGSTEYHAHLVQVRYGLISQNDYLKVIKEKITEAMFGFNDSLSFTEMSKGCLDTFKDQYGNVYAKGMLISMCLDLELLHLSNGKYGLMNLIQDLAKTYGKDKAFKDEELIPKIVSLTYPEIKTFFDDCVIGGKPLPFTRDLGYAGVNYTKFEVVKSFTFGQFEPGYNPKTGRIYVAGNKTMNEFGQAMGYQQGDEIDKINGQKISPKDFGTYREKWIKTVKVGDKFSMTVLRKTTDGKYKRKTLRSKVFMANVKTYNAIDFDRTPTTEQLAIRKAWLEAKN